MPKIIVHQKWPEGEELLSIYGFFLERKEEEREMNVKSRER